MAKYLQKAKLVPKDLGNPRAVTADDTFKDGSMMVLGRIYGEVSEIVTKADMQGRAFDELRGQFKAVPAKQQIIDGVAIDGIISGRCFLPTGFHELVVSAWKSLEGGKGMVEFAYDLGVKRAAEGSQNVIGYEWVAMPVFPLTSGERDPFANIEAKITAALPAPATVGEQPASATHPHKEKAA